MPLTINQVTRSNLRATHDVIIITAKLWLYPPHHRHPKSPVFLIGSLFSITKPRTISPRFAPRDPCRLHHRVQRLNGVCVASDYRHRCMHRKATVKVLRHFLEVAASDNRQQRVPRERRIKPIINKRSTRARTEPGSGLDQRLHQW